MNRSLYHKGQLLLGGALFLLFIFTLFSYAQADECLDLSNDLYDYAVRLYGQGNTADAVHELNKALMINPGNCKVKEFLSKISAHCDLAVLTADGVTLLPGANICQGSELVFTVALEKNYGENEFFYLWDFGDGTVVQSGPSVSYMFKAGGKYKVRVMIDDRPIMHCPRYIKEFDLTVNSFPVARIGESLVCCPDTDAFFDATESSDPDGANLTYSWDLGDGYFAQGRFVTHRFSHPGNYIVRLTVDNGSGMPCSCSSVSLVATVTERPKAIINYIQQD
jgi:hypothetical protein